MDVEGVQWDDGNWPKCASHGVSKEQVEFVLLHDPMILPDRSPAVAEVRFNAVGQTEDGRSLFVVFTIRVQQDGPFFRPISARFMHTKEIRHYEQQKGP